MESIHDTPGLSGPYIDAYNRLVEVAGCPRPGYRMELFTTARDEAAADDVWMRTGLVRASEVICLNPGAAFGVPLFAVFTSQNRIVAKL